MTKHISHHLQQLFFSYLVIFLLTFSITSIFLVSQSPSFHVSAQSGGIEPGETGQTNPKSRQPKVTATILDNGPPTTPILIAPENGSTIRVSKPHLVWKASTDVGGIDKYDVYVDGILLFPAVPTYSVDTNLYTLIYDPVTTYYTLMPKQVINDGTHTWKVVVFDDVGNTNVSVTWTFTIDTTAPHIILTDIGSIPVSISSQDLSTVPTVPIQINETNPLLQGTGEAGAFVDMVLRFENGDPSQTYSFTVASDGTWQLQLSALPINTVFYLDFTITDVMGNISLLENIPVIVKPGAVVSSPTPTPDPTFPYIPLPQDPFTPIPIELPPVIEQLIPDIPPAIQRATEKTLLDNMIVPILITTILLTRFTLLIFPLRSLISLAWIKSALKVLFFLPFVSKSKRVAVFDHATGTPIPFIPISFFKHNNSRIKNELVGFTDRRGFMYEIPEQGTWNVTIDASKTTFPTTITKPESMSIFELYRGEVISFDDTDYPYLIIPVNRAIEHLFSLREKLLLHLHLVDTKSGTFFFLLCLGLAFAFSSFINIFSVGVYLIVFMLFRLGQRITQTEISVFDINKNPLQYVIVKAKLPDLQTMIDFDISKKDGQARLDIPVSEYYLDAYKHTWVVASSKSPVIILKQAS